MDTTKRPLINSSGVLARFITGTMLMMGVDLVGARWLKFVIYLVSFASIPSQRFSHHPAGAAGYCAACAS